MPNDDPEDVLEFLRQRDRAALDETRHRERKAVITCLIFLLALAFGCVLAYLARKGVQ